MTKVIKYGMEVLGWQRKPGPLKVWRIVDGRKKTEVGKTCRFSIQEIPEERWDDVMDFMCTIFVRDEPICSHSKAIDDPVIMEDFRKLWSFALQQGIVVGAFVIDENNPEPVLAGVNMTVVGCDASEKGMLTGIEFGAELTKNILTLFHELEETKNPREVYKVDKWISAIGLCVNPDYRGQGVGLELLNARNDMGAAYGVHATTTVFTAVPAQKVATQAGFELLVEYNYVDAKKEDGTEMFPGIPNKSVKFMGKRLSG